VRNMADTQRISSTGRWSLPEGRHPYSQKGCQDACACGGGEQRGGGRKMRGVVVVVAAAVVVAVVVAAAAVAAVGAARAHSGGDQSCLRSPPSWTPFSFSA
jgi:hypothetical protein